MQNFLLALTLPFVVQPMLLNTVHELPKSATDKVVRSCDIAPSGNPYYGPAC
jgi:hypothetical protein